MNLFYTTNIEGNYAHLNEIEARHAVQVLRKREGDALDFVDGLGTYYKGIIHETGKKKCVVEIKEQIANFEQLPYRLHIAIAPTKNMDRLEWFVEKCTEIGIHEITPIFCHHSERRRLKEERLEKIAVSAMKQSLKAYKPIINPAIKLSQFLKTADAPSKFIAHCEDSPKTELIKALPASKDILILIGPEGDFSVDEIASATQQGFSAIALGQSRLRTETAGIVACHTVALSVGN